MEEVIASIGPKLRELRQQKGLSLKQLAERSGVSAAAIHKIERNNMVPTITTLMRLATALNRSVAWFVSENEHEDRAAALVRSRDRRPVYTSKTGLALEGISGPYGRFLIAGALARVEPGASSGRAPMEHLGEELVYVLEGSIEIQVAGEDFALRRGDALHFRTDRPHRWRNPGARPARLLWLALRQP
ncbi:MAG TPA: cupin domain-containing protein [Actinomycetota bacterium]|nr:cupin domain-containing protein [Actinomycetota bacterium]